MLKCSNNQGTHIVNE